MRRRNQCSAHRGLGHEFWREIADVRDFPSVGQGQEGVEQAGGQVEVLAEDFPEGDVGHGAEVFARCHHNKRFLRGKDTTKESLCQVFLKIF